MSAVLYGMHGFSSVACWFLCWFFFFQAEDGIRDLVRSRGLGDVYKRQVFNFEGLTGQTADLAVALGLLTQEEADFALSYAPVSYTHLTLPTSDLV